MRVCKRTIQLPKIGKVRTREACRFAGPVRECTVVHDGTRWYAAVVCDVAEPDLKETGDVVGVDVGLRHLATIYDGVEFEVVPNPRPLRKALSKLRTVNRGLAKSRRIYGEKRHSNRRERRYRELRHLHVRVSHLRLCAWSRCRSRAGCGTGSCRGRRRMRRRAGFLGC